MKKSDRKKYYTEEFTKLYPLIFKLLEQVKITDRTENYEVNGRCFQIKQNRDVVEMGLPNESPIFPTLAFKQLPNNTFELMEYRIGEDFKKAIYEATERYVDIYTVGDLKCVAVYYKKQLNSNGNYEIAFQSKTKRFMDKWQGQSAYLEISDLSYWEVDWLAKEQPNTHKLFCNSKAQLVISFGKQEWLAKDSSPHSISINDNKAIIMWQVESMECFNGIAYALNANKELSLKIEITCNDTKLGERVNEKCFGEDIYKISVSFE